MKQTSVFTKIIKQEKQADGSLLVTGIASDDSIDGDEQICDPKWLSKAMPEWFLWGNIREQHSNIAAGVATEYKAEGSRHIITARVVDPSSVKKVESGVLKGFSIGIRNPRVQTDNKAVGGRIVDGTIVEVSLVDRPANPNCLLSLAKSVNGEIQQVEELVEKDFGTETALGTAQPAAAASAKMCDKCGQPMGMDDKACKMCDGLEGDHKAAEESSQKIGEESSQKIGEESSRVGGVAGVAGLAATKADEESTMEESTETSEMTEETASKAIEESTMEESTEESTKNYAKASDEESTENSGEDATPKSDDSHLAKIEARLESIEKQLSMLVKSAQESSETSAKDIAKSVEAITERVSKVEKSASRGPVRVVAKMATEPGNDAKRQIAEYQAKAAKSTDPILAKGYLMLAAELESTLNK